MKKVYLIIAADNKSMIPFDSRKSLNNYLTKFSFECEFKTNENLFSGKLKDAINVEGTRYVRNVHVLIKECVRY